MRGTSEGSGLPGGVPLVPLRRGPSEREAGGGVGTAGKMPSRLCPLARAAVPRAAWRRVSVHRAWPSLRGRGSCRWWPPVPRSRPWCASLERAPWVTHRASASPAFLVPITFLSQAGRLQEEKALSRPPNTLTDGLSPGSRCPVLRHEYFPGFTYGLVNLVTAIHPSRRLSVSVEG